MPARLLEPGLWGAVAKATCTGGVRALPYCLYQRSGSPPVPWYCASALAVAVALLRGLVLAPIKRGQRYDDAYSSYILLYRSIYVIFSLLP